MRFITIIFAITNLHMKPSYIVTILLLLFVKSVAQEFNPKINKDSLYQVVLKSLPDEKKAEFTELYKTGNKQSQEFLLFMLSMPRSSKAEMITNLEKNNDKINTVKHEFAKLVPKGLTVFVEFDPANKILNTPPVIDLHIYGLDDKIKEQAWGLNHGSKELKDRLKKIGWTEETLTKIKKLLDDAKCISVQNGEKQSEVGFARSGMGKYTYKIFNQNLNGNQIAEYNDGCNYIFYKENIVLEYGGGATGPQCFPD